MKLIDLLVKELPKLGGWPEGVTHIGQDYDRELMFYGRGNIRTGLILNELAIDHRKLGKSGEKITRAQYEAAIAASKAVVGHNGWINWDGGECPVEEDTLVDVRFRNGADDRNIEANHLRWSHKNLTADIIAYRLQKPTESEQVRSDAWCSCAGTAETDDETDLNECIGQDVVTEWNGEGLPPVACECELKYKCHNDDAYWERVIILWKRGDDTLVEYVGDHFKNTTQLIHKTSMHVDFRPLRAESERRREVAAKEMARHANSDQHRKFNAGLRNCLSIYDAIAAGKIPGVKLESK